MAKDMSVIDPDMNLDLMTFQDRLEAGIQNTSQITGQATLVDKSSLVDVPFIVTDFAVVKASKDIDAPEYLNVKIITQTNECLCFNDGGLGIKPVLYSWRDKNPHSLGLMCARGLRVSNYEYEGRPAETYYLT